MKAVYVLCASAAVFWLMLFSPWTSPHIPFWLLLAAAAGILGAGSLILGRKDNRRLYELRLRYFTVGIASAYVLYVVFLASRVSLEYFAPFARQQIAAVYSRKAGTPAAYVAMLLFFWIGPAEEIFWRGFIQHRLAEKLGSTQGWLCASLLYAGIHAGSLNPVLMTAALVCGLFWGAMFKKFGSVWPGLISHASWDLLVFILWPLQ
ncbi:MAG TPA: type II CAAX endopeptidase family protein [Patescibacteria group bacterium]|nr:type II CAAX endopeptidase family protein [Patescibacteria group bacterium]